ncbi:hypothetical protein OIU77_014129 [Salix suchowensis]|uniref:Uncharacterized protein n=1 Tax=Salix suchowensis TaxID=1278906 RepID=A0ABQ8ZXV2_9ROSI|nr:hypothetical protein OIU77_014129 [Salix suchowensis]
MTCHYINISLIITENNLRN